MSNVSGLPQHLHAGFRYVSSGLGVNTGSWLNPQMLSNASRAKKILALTVFLVLVFNMLLLLRFALQDRVDPGASGSRTQTTNTNSVPGSQTNSAIQK